MNSNEYKKLINDCVVKTNTLIKSEGSEKVLKIVAQYINDSFLNFDLSEKEKTNARRYYLTFFINELFKGEKQ